MPSLPNRLHQAARLAATILLSTIFALACRPAAASATDAPNSGTAGTRTIHAAAPAGFDHLLAPQRGGVDVYFGGRRVGQAEAVFSPGAFRFVHVSAVISLLQDIVDRDSVGLALSEPLDPHASRICTAGDESYCGRLDPPVAGVIFDAARFRVDIFVNPRLRAVQTVGAERYLPKPVTGVSLIDAVGVTVAGTGRDAPIYNFENRAIIGDGAFRVRSDLSWTSGYGLRADVLAAELDKHDIRYSAGSLWAPGVELTGRRKMLGVSIETQLDTRLDRNLIQGVPLVVFLQQRAQVDILREGRLLISRIYEAGNQSLDTSGLPDGSYDIVLRIQEADGTHREERRFYSKLRRIAPLGRPLIGVYAGVLSGGGNRRSIATVSVPFFEAAYAYRVRPSIALDATLLTTDRHVLLQLGGNILTRLAQVRVAALAGANGDVGLLAQFSSAGRGPLAVNFDVRAVSTRKGGPLLPDGADYAPAYDSATGNLENGSYVQLSGNVSYRLGAAELGLLTVYHRAAGHAAFYSAGPSIRWPFLRRGGVEMAFSANFAVTERSRSGFAGFGFRRLLGRSSIGATAGARIAAGGGEDSGAVAAVDATWQRSDVLGGELDTAAGLSHDADSSTATGSATLRTVRGTAAIDLAHRFDASGGTQYGLALRTGFVAGGGDIALQGGEGESSAVAVKITAAPVGARFDVLIDNDPRATIEGSGTATIALQAYRQYHVRIRSRDGTMLHYDGAQRLVSLYPGNVATLDWSAVSVAALFGRLLWPDGRPIGDADISAPGAIARTDSQGYFLITASPAGILGITSPTGGRCQVKLENITPVEGYAAIGDTICRPANTSIIAALSTEKQ